MPNMPARNCWDRISETYAVPASKAEYWKPAAQFPSLIFPMKKPEIQHWRIIPTENIRICSCMATKAVSERLVLTTVVIMYVVKETIVVVTAIKQLHMKARMI